MIPKIIHYCWFGNNKFNELAEKCIKSWKKYCPDYEFILWNEENFDVNSNIYVKEAYETKKWAFVTDYVRLYALYNYGGIYMDTDVELFQNIDIFLNNTAFSGFESDDAIPTAIMGSEKHGEWVSYLLSYYDNRHFKLEDGTCDITTNVITITNMTKQKYNIVLDNSYQKIENILTLYPKQYFCPKDYQSGIINIKDETVCIHHFNASWHNAFEKKMHMKKLKYIKKFGEDNWNNHFLPGYYFYVAFYIFNKYGFKSFAKRTIKKIFKMIINIIKTDDRVLFFESEGDFCDNGRALSDYLINNGYNDKYRIIWKVKDAYKFKKYKFKNLKFISSKSFLGKLKLLYYVAKSKYFFFTHPYWLKNWKKDQSVINLWHGIPLKGAGKDLSNLFDYLVVSSEFSKQMYEKFLGAKYEQMIDLGMPRLDFMDCDIKSRLSKVFSISFEKIVLCMPTFRQTKNWEDGKFKNMYSINCISNFEDLNTLNDYLKNKNILFIVKIHHLQNMEFTKKENLSNILYLKDEDLFKNNIQLYQLVGNADCLLTDYSSVFFDYLLLDRPIGFFINDFDEYSRGFIFDNPMDYMPGEKIKSNKELYSFLDNIVVGRDSFKNDRKKVLDLVYSKVDFCNCKRIVEYFKL